MTEPDAASVNRAEAADSDSAGRGALIGLVDQGLSSVSNALVVISYARVSSPESFGVFAILLTVVTAALALGRGGIGTPIMLAGRADLREVRAEARGGLAASCLLGFGAAGLVAAFGSILGATELITPVALCAIFTLQQDAMRYASLGLERGRSALISDSVWFGASLTLLLVTIPFPPSPALVAWGWTAGSMLALVAAYATLRISPAFGQLRCWWARRRSARVRLTIEAASGSLSALVLTSALAIVIGTTGVAALRGAGTVMGPLSLLFSAVSIAVIPRAVRQGASKPEVWRLLRRMAIPMMLAALLIGVVFSQLPPTIGQALLGATWPDIARIIAFTGIEYAGLAWLYCCWAFFKTFVQTKPLLATRLSHLTFAAAFAIIGGAATHQALGASIGLALASVSVAAVATVLAARRAQPLE